MQKEEKFKQTEIGFIPEEWEVVKLEEVVDFTKKPKTLNLSEIKNIPFIPMETIPIEKLYIDGYLLKNPDEITSGVYCEKGDILLAKITPSFENGKQGIVENIPYDFAFATTEVYPLKPRNNLDKLFLFYFLIKSDVREAIAGKMQGTTGRKRVPKEAVGNTLIPLPPLPEQQKIATVLSAIQRAIEHQDKIIATTKKLKKSLMHTLFTEGLNGEEQKETEIGLIPEEWDVVKLGDVTEKTKQTDPRKNPDNEFKYIDVSGISNELFRIVEFKEYLGKEAPSRARKLVKVNDIIFATVRPYLKRVAIVPEDFDGEICSTAFCVVRCKGGIVDPIFVFNYLLTDTFVDKVSELQRGSSYPAVTDKDVLNQKIPLPPLPEQHQIAHILSTVDNKIDVEERRKTTLKELFKTMLHKLMSGAIRVNKVEI